MFDIEHHPPKLRLHSFHFLIQLCRASYACQIHNTWLQAERGGGRGCGYAANFRTGNGNRKLHRRDNVSGDGSGSHGVL